ncbi:cytidylate kinase family protein [Clostridium estertheticum]|nr:cytidylate kinase family protein [Clostridium estertheticum]
MSIREIVKRYLFFVLGLFMMAVGVVLSTRSNLGTSPISCVPYVLSLGLPMTIGQFTFLMNLLFIIFQILLLRKQFKPIQLLQVVVAFLFAYFTDFTMGLLSWISVTSYPAQIGLFILSCLILALGVSMEVTADVVMMAGEGVVSAISIVTKKEFGKLKVAFDVTLVICGFLFSFILFHRLNGIREGTVLAALLVGTLVRLINKHLSFMDTVFKGKAITVNTSQVLTTAQEIHPLVVTISREYGSGGRDIGKKIAADLGISFYDTQLLKTAAEETGLSEKFIAENDQFIPNLLLNQLLSQGYAFSKKEKDPLNAIYESEKRAIMKIANTESCVIMEHCSDSILADYKGSFHVFIHADKASRMKRIQYEYGISEKNVEETLHKTDRARETYYQIYAERKWGRIKNYDLTVNSAVFGLEKTTELIEEAIKGKEANK